MRKKIGLNMLPTVIIMAFMLAVPGILTAGTLPPVDCPPASQREIDTSGPPIIVDLVISRDAANVYTANGMIVCRGKNTILEDIDSFDVFLNAYFGVGTQLEDLTAENISGLLVDPFDFNLAFGDICAYPPEGVLYYFARVPSFSKGPTTDGFEVSFRAVIFPATTECVDVE
jgi:hypothetical protein